jgi:hypothetical protein
MIFDREKFAVIENRFVRAHFPELHGTCLLCQSRISFFATESS